MKIYANLIDENKTLVMYRVKYSVSTVKNYRTDCYKYYIGYEEDIVDNLQIIGDFYKYIDRTHNSKELVRQHLDTKINSIKYMRKLNSNSDENGKYILAHNVDSISEVVFSDSFFFIKNVVKVG